VKVICKFIENCQKSREVENDGKEEEVEDGTSQEKL
jgi:hypothetical protein